MNRPQLFWLILTKFDFFSLIFFQQCWQIDIGVFFPMFHILATGQENFSIGTHQKIQKALCRCTTREMWWMRNQCAGRRSFSRSCQYSAMQQRTTNPALLAGELGWTPRTLYPRVSAPSKGSSMASSPALPSALDAFPMVMNENECLLIACSILFRVNGYNNSMWLSWPMRWELQSRKRWISFEILLDRGGGWLSEGVNERTNSSDDVGSWLWALVVLTFDHEIKRIRLVVDWAVRKHSLGISYLSYL